MATRAKFARLARYSRECVEMSHIFLKNLPKRVSASLRDTACRVSASLASPRDTACQVSASLASPHDSASLASPRNTARRKQAW